MKKSILLFCILYLFIRSHAQVEKIEEMKLRLYAEKNDTTKINMLSAIADSYIAGESKNRDSALLYLQKASDLSKKIKYSKGQLKANTSIAEMMARTGNLTDALSLSLRNLELAEQMNDAESLFWIKRSIMWIYEGVGDHKNSLHVAHQMDSLIHINKFLRSRNRLVYEMIIFYSLGSIYGHMNQPDSSLHYLLIVYNHRDSIPVMAALSSGPLGELYYTRNQFDSALTVLRTGIIAAKIANRPELVNNNKMIMAEVFQKQEKPDSAFAYARQLFDDFPHNLDSSTAMNVAVILSDLFREKKQMDSAYKYLKLSVSIKDSLQESEKIAKTRDMLFSETLHQQQIEQQRSEAALQYKSRLKIYGLLGGLSILLVLAIMLYRNNLQRQRSSSKIKQAYDELRSTQTQLIHSEKMASLGELTAGIAHEIQNPLNFINNFSDVNKELLTELNEEIEKGNYDDAKSIAKDVIDNEEKINHHGKRADAIVKGMLQHSRTSTGQKELTDINALCDEYLRLSYHGLRAKDKSFNAIPIGIETDFDNSIGKINIVPQDIGRVLLNLINNAFYAVSEKVKPLAVSYEPLVIISTKKLTDKVEIKVKDNGNGISQKILDKIFQPFFTTKPTGQGTGLGLSLSYDIIKAHGGEIKVATREGDGSEFVIQLPTTS